MPPMEGAFWSAVARYHSPQVPPLNPDARSEFQEVRWSTGSFDFDPRVLSIGAKSANVVVGIQRS